MISTSNPDGTCTASALVALTTRTSDLTHARNRTLRPQGHSLEFRHGESTCADPRGTRCPAHHRRGRRDPQHAFEFLKDYLLSTPAKGFVLGISGGQDSTLTGRLAQLAASELRDEGHDAEFVAVRLPYGVQADESDAQISLDFIKPDRSVIVNVKPGADATAEGIVRGAARDHRRRR